MRKIALTLIFAMSGGAAMAADPVEGVWKTKPDDNGNFGHVRVEACGALICGTLIRAFDPQGKEIESKNVGKRIVWDMKPYGDGVYDDGKVWSPDRDKTYNSDMELRGNRLTVRGCVLGICRDGGAWTRVK